MMEAFVTLATNDSYAIGALVWAYALRQLQTSKHICIMVTDAVSHELRSLLAEVADSVQPVQPVLVPASATSAATAALNLLGRPDLQGESLGLAKLRVWQLSQFAKVAYMDADTLPLVNIDELLDRDELSAAPDPGWPDWFNSGVMVLRPSEATFQLLMRRAADSPGSLVDGSDQGLLNTCLADRWKSADISRRLPFGYNCLSYAFYSYLPALRHFRDSIKVVHFAGAGQKPWQLSRRPLMDQTAEFRAEFLGEWWTVYDACVLHRLASAGHSVSVKTPFIRSN
uniref:glycogenin glucosyltransferase n=1 Tax=Macrostomum lignano TaxID=282301 RepID=A0A1I8HR44_9PLAT